MGLTENFSQWRWSLNDELYSVSKMPPYYFKNNLVKNKPIWNIKKLIHKIQKKSGISNFAFV